MRHSRGLSLIEVIFAFTLLGLILMVLFNLFPASVMSVKHAELRIKAIAIAQSILDNKRAAAFSSFALGAESVDDSSFDSGNEFETTLECYNVDLTDSNNLKRMRATVVWSEKNVIYSVSKEQDICVIQH